MAKQAVIAKLSYKFNKEDLKRGSAIRLKITHKNFTEFRDALVVDVHDDNLEVAFYCKEHDLIKYDKYHIDNIFDDFISIEIL